MKKCFVSALSLAGAWLGLFLGASGSAQARERNLLDADWRFHLGDMPEANQPAFDDHGWRTVDLPHDWSIEGTVGPGAPGNGGSGYFPGGIGWYRHSFRAPRSWIGRRILVEFEGVYMNAGVWINGESVGGHPYGYTSFFCDLTSHLKIGGPNVLAVRVDNSQQPNSRWYSGSGVYRHVWLHVTDPVHVAPWGIFASTTEASAAAAKIRVEATVRNETDAPQSLTLEIALIDPSGRSVAAVRAEGQAAARGDFTAAPQVAFARPQLWSLETPVLYRVVTRVLIGRRLADEIETPFGVRTITVSADRGFELNGRPLKLAGGNVHHDNGPLGAAAFDRAEERRVELLKAAGFNVVRTAHNPPSPAFLEACDRLGLLVLDEAFDCWEKGKNPHDYGVVFKDWWQRDLDAIVLRDRNHPSVVMWSIGNEVYERATPEGARIARMLTNRIRELDSTRPITAGLNGAGPQAGWTEIDPVFATLDIAGYNYELHRHADDHARLPSRVLLATESYQSEAFQNWVATNDHPYVIGDFVWSALDYLGEAGIGRVFPPDQPAVRHWEGVQYPWHGAYCGDLDITGWRKPASHYRNIVWDRGEKLYAAVLTPSPGGKPWNLTPWSMPPALPSWTWPGQDGKELTVEVDSRYDAVRLYLNGRLLGEKPTTRAEEFKATFAVPYAPGTLQAMGVQNGREVQVFTLTTAGDAARLLLTPDRAAIHADGQDLSFVMVEATDRDGHLQPNADPAVRFALSGPGVIAGIGTGDMTTMESYQANPHHVFHGRALIVIRSTPQAGEIKLVASAPGLADATMILHSVSSQ
jgi:beta-galactosidase